MKFLLLIGIRIIEPECTRLTVLAFRTLAFEAGGTTRISNPAWIICAPATDKDPEIGHLFI